MLNKKYYIKMHVRRDVFRRRNLLLHEAYQTIEADKANEAIEADEADEAGKADKIIRRNK